MYQTRNILVGAAALYISVKDSTDETYDGGPDLPAVTSGSMTAALDDADDEWRHTGFTTDGLSVSYEPDYADVEVDQLLDAARMFKQSMRVTVSTTLSEASLENLLVVWGQHNETLSDTSSVTELGMAAGGLGDEPTERGLVAVSVAPRTVAGQRRERVYHARRVLSVETTEHGMMRNEATTFPVTFRLLPDPNYPNSEYGIIRDRNVTS